MRKVIQTNVNHQGLTLSRAKYYTKIAKYIKKRTCVSDSTVYCYTKNKMLPTPSPKPGKPLENVKSYRPTILLPTMSKVVKKLILSRLQPTLIERKLLPEHQFGFRPQHVTKERIHRICKPINRVFEDKMYCSMDFLDISQTWHSGFLYKLRKTIPLHYYLILKSYLQDRCFYVQLWNDRTSLFPINSRVPQGSVLGPVLYLLYKLSCLPTIISPYTDDSAVFYQFIEIQFRPNTILAETTARFCSCK